MKLLRFIKNFARRYVFSGVIACCFCFVYLFMVAWQNGLNTGVYRVVMDINLYGEALIEAWLIGLIPVMLLVWTILEFKEVK